MRVRLSRGITRFRQSHDNLHSYDTELVIDRGVGTDRCRLCDPVTEHESWYGWHNQHEKHYRKGSGQAQYVPKYYRTVWCSPSKPYHPSSTSIRDGRAVSVTYGSGTFSGVQYNDTSISVATQAQGFEGYDGILGLGPATLTAGTLAGTNALIPTVMQTLKSQGSIEQNVLGVYFQPLVGSNVTELNGELSLGGPDPSRYTGNITFTNVTSNYPYSLYWGIDMDTITYDGDNNKTILTNAAPAIIDTVGTESPLSNSPLTPQIKGTTLTYIPTATMNAFLAVSDGRIDPDTNLPAFQTKPSSNITFIISGTSLTLSPDQYLVSQEQYPLFGLNQTFFYAWFGDGGASGTDAQYSVYDTTNSRVGFAPAFPKGTERKFEAGTAISATSSARKDEIISRQVRINPISDPGISKMGLLTTMELPDWEDRPTTEPGKHSGISPTCQDGQVVTAVTRDLV
ncbi:Asp domain-containing protein [Rhizoctonia solani AG-1 IA]|uniref:Asp domain-containing protein n=1 Tax=Thanatephorus cucumeris (strain AG1-IA) TaxID=983506 RepID=L8WKL2_THACA|nr:Asp domain-containing protein [Rhizoctonia solani AG-1 IA]